MKRTDLLASATHSPPPAPGVGPHHHHHRAHTRHAHPHAAATGGFHTQLQNASVADALKTAMEKESVPQSWEPSLQFIVERESSGKVGVHNKVDTARGLFQLTAASYHLNPHGAASFGNAVEEAQGGIRYIQERYQTADNAANFWQRHGWY